MSSYYSSKDKRKGLIVRGLGWVKTTRGHPDNAYYPSEKQLQRSDSRKRKREKYIEQLSSFM
jgi:hypothetical protein